MKILVIEDDKDLGAEIVEYLLRSGHEVDLCRTAAAARDALEAMTASGAVAGAVACDVGLPDGDGADLCLAFAPRTGATRWLLMSGSQDFERLEEMLAGLAPRPIVIEKPVSLRRLRALLEGADS